MVVKNNMITFLLGVTWLIYVIIAIIIVGGAIYLLDIAPIDSQVKSIGKFVIIIVLIIIALLFLLQIVGSGTLALK